jgi:uracil-DNA glycosylase family 4
MAPRSLSSLNRTIINCHRCPRLVAWRERVALEKRACFREQAYWGRPVPGFGDPLARLLVVGLAPAAHGGNRTGRVFTGDRSGEWLFRALYKTGFASQPDSISRQDGLRLKDCYVTACVRCAPPANRPTPLERDTCLEFLVQELHLLDRLRLIVCLGSFAWLGVRRALAQANPAWRLKERFAHGVEATVDCLTVLGSYHPSQQNTFTGRLTEKMLDKVFLRALALLNATESGVKASS